MDYDILDGAPCSLLGVHIKTRTQIIFTCLVPAIFELIIYVFLTVADIAVAYQHYTDGNNGYGSLTLTLLCLPAAVTFISVIISPWQWPEGDSWSWEHTKFFVCQIFNMVLFPIGAIHRFSRRIFWSIDSLFYDRDTYDRLHTIAKAAEHSPFEMYHFIQAFVQAAPQIILQLYIILRDNMFRNFETVTAQAFSLTFSFLTMGIIIATYQRFESQKCVGRTYPWSSEHEVAEKKRSLKRLSSIPEFKRQASSNVEFLRISTDENRDSTNEPYSRKTINIDQNNFDIAGFGKTMTDDEKMEQLRDTVDHGGPSKPPSTPKKVRLNIPLHRLSDESNESPLTPDHEFIENIEEVKSFLRSTGDIDVNTPRATQIHSEDFDLVPSVAPPPLPPESAASSEHKIFNFNRFSTFKDDLVLKTQTYIKEHVPRLPENLFEKTEKPVHDEVDFPLPSRSKMIEGIEQDDFIGKLVSATGWSLFLIMRMISLSTFSVFYLAPCIHILYAHYMVMVVCLFWETKFQEKCERMYFYLFLGYVYVFALLEFKIKFKQVRWWYVGYFCLVFTENIAITIVWHSLADYSNYWFHFLFIVIIFSGILSMACLLLYYMILKPANKVLIATE